MFRSLDLSFLLFLRTQQQVSRLPPSARCCPSCFFPDSSSFVFLSQPHVRRVKHNPTTWLKAELFMFEGYGPQGPRFSLCFSLARSSSGSASDLSCHALHRCHCNPPSKCPLCKHWPCCLRVLFFLIFFGLATPGHRGRLSVFLLSEGRLPTA